ALGLSSESSYRFERGIDMLAMPDALARAVALIRAVAGGEMREPPIDLWPEPQQPRSVFLREARVSHLLGVPVPRKEIERLLSAEEAHLRSRLLPGLVRRVEHNWSVGNRDVRLFEVGTVFRKGSGPRPEEELHLAIVLTGARHPPHWTDTANAAKLPDMDIWDLKQHFELAGGLAWPPDDVQPAANGSGWVAPAGTAGPLEADAPRWAAPLFGLEVRIVVAPLGLVRYQPLPTQPPVVRDISLVLPGTVTAGAVETV